MSDLKFDIHKYWLVDEWYGEVLVIWASGNYNTPLLMLHKDDVERLIKIWNTKRTTKDKKVLCPCGKLHSGLICKECGDGLVHDADNNAFCLQCKVRR